MANEWNVVNPYISLWESEPQGEPISVWAKDDGGSEGQPVMGWTGVEPGGSTVRTAERVHHPTRKRADFQRVLDGRKGEEVGNEMFR